VFVNREAQGKRNHHGCVFPFDHCRTWNHIARPQLLKRVKPGRSEVFLIQPIHWPRILERRIGIAFLQWQPGQSYFFRGHNGLQHKAVYKDAALGIHHEWAESLAELLVKSIADRPDIPLAANE